METVKQNVKKLEYENNIKKEKLAQEIKLKEKQAQIDVERNYDPAETGYAETMAQLQATGDKGVEMMKHEMDRAQYDSAFAAARQNFDTAYNNLLDSYDQGYKNRVENKLWQIVRSKYDALHNNLDDFNLNELTNTTELMNRLLNYDMMEGDDDISPLLEKQLINEFTWN